MTEQHGSYNVHNNDADDDRVEHIGDVLRRLIDHRGWPPLITLPRVNGKRPGTDDGPSCTGA